MLERERPAVNRQREIDNARESDRSAVNRQTEVDIARERERERDLLYTDRER